MRMVFVEEVAVAFYMVKIQVDYPIFDILFPKFVLPAIIGISL